MANELRQLLLANLPDFAAVEFQQRRGR
jgi:hypothetical protein